MGRIMDKSASRRGPAVQGSDGNATRGVVVALTGAELECLVSDFAAVDDYYGGPPEPGSADESGRKKLTEAFATFGAKAAGPGTEGPHKQEQP